MVNIKHLVLVTSGLLLVAGILCDRARSPVSPGLVSTGGSSLVITNISLQPLFLQADPRWGNDTIGGSGETLSAVGCTVSCLSMAATQLGVPLNPGELNAKLKEAGGYTERGWLKWDVASAVLGDPVDIRVPRRPSHDRIDAGLEAGDLIVAKILLWASVPHWVLIVGKQGNEYLVKNPLAREERLQRLSELSDTIEAIRIVRGRGA